MRRIFYVMLLAIAGCNRPPVFSLQGYFFVSAPDEELAKRENQRIVETVQSIVLAIVEGKPDALLEHVNKQEGAIVDAKAVVPYVQVASALHNKNSQLYRVLWDDQYWKETAPKENIHSYRKTFLSAGEIRLGLFYYSATECEVRLDFKDRPSIGIMANLILRKRDNRWYMMNFF